MRISIVINAHNEEKNIGACLCSLKAQTKKPLEIIVINQRSSDKTASISKKHGAIVYEYGGPTRGDARDYGWRKARGDYVIYLDADDVVNKTWLEGFIFKFSEGYEAVLDELRVHNPNTIFLKLFDWQYYSRKELSYSAWGYKKSLLKKLGGFKEGWIEEGELALRMKESGVKIGYARESVRYHMGNPRSFCEYLIRQFKSGRLESKWLYSDNPKKPLAKLLFLAGYISLAAIFAIMNYVLILPLYASYLLITALFVMRNRKVSAGDIIKLFGNTILYSFAMVFWSAGYLREKI